MGFRFRAVRDPGSMRPPSTVRARRSTIASCGWGAKGVWTAIFRTLASACRPPAHVQIDSSAVKAHRCASGGKGGTHAGNRPLTRWADNEDPRPTYDLCCPIAFLLTGGQVADCTAIDTLLEPIPATAIPHGDKGYDRDAVRRNREQGRRPEHSAKGQQATEELLFALPPAQSQRHRAHVRTPLGLLPNRDPVRSPRSKLPRRRLRCRYRPLLVMCLEPRCQISSARFVFGASDKFSRALPDRCGQGRERWAASRSPTGNWDRRPR
jgi:hypothetical protein